MEVLLSSESLKDCLTERLSLVKVPDDVRQHVLSTLMEPKPFHKHDSVSIEFMEALQAPGSTGNFKLRLLSDRCLVTLGVFRGYASSRGLVELFTKIGIIGYQRQPDGRFNRLAADFRRVTLFLHEMIVLEPTMDRYLLRF